MKLKKSFFQERASEVAPKLLRKKICIKGLEAIITEVEAYEGKNDEASHAYKFTERSKIMHETYGKWYVYFIYGNDYCLNVTCGKEAGAVLIREAMPIKGIKKMKKNRRRENINELSNGPGKLTQAFGIDKRFNGKEFDELCIKETSERELRENSLLHNKVVAGKRVGIKKGLEKNWRFKLE